MSSDSHEVAWAAGFYDGEGCLWHAKSKGRLYPRLQVGQKGRETLDRLQAALGGRGTIYRAGNRDGMWFLRIVRRDHLQEAIDLLWPYLSEPKRRQIAEVLARCEESMRMTTDRVRRVTPLTCPYFHNQQ